MPQDNLRSAVYRSFVLCDDPKGVVEFGTIRKSRSNSRRLEEKAESQKMPTNLNSSSSSSSSAYKKVEKEMVSGKGTEDFHNHDPSSFQLMEVSKGAQKLNQVIDSWSKGMDFDGNSKEIAKDLLKGALDLQESLIMLGKLQEASQYMAKLKKKQKEKSKGESLDQVGIKTSKSLHFKDHNYDKGFQKPRLSDCGCSRDVFERNEKSMGERVYELGIERTSSDHFIDHNYQTRFQKPRVSDYGYSRDCSEQKEESTRERIHEVEIERTNFHDFMDPNYQTRFQKPRLFLDEKYRGERFQEVGIERTNSLGDRNHQTGFQKPRLSADGYSRDCFDELRTAIVDSLARQNLLPPNCIEKRDFCEKRAPDSAPDIPSTSSSQSLMDNSNESSSSNSYFSSKAPNRPKGSNLIAKLMGLEEIPRKQLENEKISSPRRAVFDIDMPKPRKPESAANKVETEHVKLKEIVETMQFKGLLKKRNAAEGLGFESRHSNVLDSKKRITADTPPIVIMRPWHITSTDDKEPHLQKLIGEMEALDMYRSGGGLNSVEMCRRVKRGDETPTKRITQEGYKSSRVAQAKPGEIAVKKLSSNKSKASVAVNQQQRKKEIEKKVDKVQKVAPCRKKPTEVENVKSKGVIKSQDAAKVTFPKERKHEMGLIIAKSRTSQQKSTSSSIISRRTKAVLSHKSSDRKNNRNNDRPVDAPLAADFVVENGNVGYKYGDKVIDFRCKNEADTARTKPARTEQFLTDEGTDAPIDAGEYDSSQNALYSVSPQTSQPESIIELAEETKHCVSENITETKRCRTETNAKDLFLSSPLFLSYAEELFDINSNDAIRLQTTSLNNHETDDTTLLLDCANELMRNKILRCKQKVHPILLVPVSSSRSSISLSELAEEVSNGIENLRSYCKNLGENFPKDKSFSVLERDQRCQGVVSGGWDLGWKHAFTVDEVERIIGDIQKMIFNELIEVMFADFML